MAVAIAAAGRTIRSDWDVHFVDNNLIYVNEQCGQADVDPKFFLHVTPVDRRALPLSRWIYGFESLDFHFRDYRLKVGEEVCVAQRTMPGYDIATVRTGQYIPGEGPVWEGGFDIAGRAGEDPAP